MQPINLVTEQTDLRLQELEDQLRFCPKCKTRQKLTDTLIQKKKFGGISSEQNTIKEGLCPPCNADYTNFAANFTDVVDLDEWKSIYALFLKQTPQELTTVQKQMAQLKELTGLRMELHEEGQRFLGRYSMRAKRLDELVNVNETSFKKEAAEISDRMKSSREPGWLDVLMAPKAEIDAQKLLLEKQIAKLIKDHPVWNQFALYIPGIGPWTVGFIMAKIGDPRRFKTSSDLRGYAGLRIDDQQHAQGRQRFKSNGAATDPSDKKSLDFSPSLKTMICKLMPDAMAYQKTRFPDSPYSKQFAIYRDYLIKRVNAVPPTQCNIKGCKETEIINLGWEETEDGKKFLGYCCQKTHGKVGAHKFYNPAHLNNMVNRRVGTLVLNDIYHVWLWFLGENLRIEGNPRIMWVLEQAMKG